MNNERGLNISSDLNRYSSHSHSVISLRPKLFTRIFNHLILIHLPWIQFDCEVHPPFNGGHKFMFYGAQLNIQCWSKKKKKLIIKFFCWGCGHFLLVEIVLVVKAEGWRDRACPRWVIGQVDWTVSGTSTVADYISVAISTVDIETLPANPLQRISTLFELI